MPTATDRFVTLRGGLIVPAEPYLLLLDFERRGVRVDLDGPDLLIGPRAYLTADDRAAIKRWKPHLHQLVRYCLAPEADAHLFHDTRPAHECEATR